MSEHREAASGSRRWRPARLRPPYASVLDLIGNTPMVELTNFDTGPCRLFVKLESQNPGGSIKDRIALSMIEAAEKRRQAEAAAAPSSRRPPATPASAWPRSAS